MTDRDDLAAAVVERIIQARDDANAVNPTIQAGWATIVEIYAYALDDIARIVHPQGPLTDGEA